MPKRICAALLVAFHLSACSTMRPVEAPGAGGGFAVNAGDNVLAWRHGGGSVPLRVARSDPEEICGDSECVRVADVARLERSEIDPARTTWLAVGIVLLFAAVFAAASSVAAGSMLGAVPVFP